MVPTTIQATASSTENLVDVIPSLAESGVAFYRDGARDPSQSCGIADVNSSTPGCAQRPETIYQAA